MGCGVVASGCLDTIDRTKNKARETQQVPTTSQPITNPPPKVDTPTTLKNSSLKTEPAIPNPKTIDLPNDIETPKRSTTSYDPPSYPHKHRVRIWTSHNGHKVNASFLWRNAGTVALIRDDGTTIKVPFDKLSESDQKAIRQGKFD